MGLRGQWDETLWRLSDDVTLNMGREQTEKDIWNQDESPNLN